MTLSRGRTRTESRSPFLRYRFILSNMVRETQLCHSTHVQCIPGLPRCIAALESKMSAAHRSIWLLRCCEVRARQWNQDGGESNLNLGQSFFWIPFQSSCLYSFMAFASVVAHMHPYMQGFFHHWYDFNFSWFRSFAAGFLGKPSRSKMQCVKQCKRP